MRRYLSGGLIACALSLAFEGGAAWAAEGKSRPLAIIEGEAITEQEVDREIAAQVGKLEEQLYNLRRRRLEALIEERLLAREAAKRSVSVAALLDAEVTSKVPLVTEQEVERYVQANRGRFKGEASTVREEARARLQAQRLTAQRAAFVQDLRVQANIAVYLNAPPVARAQVATEGAPAKGPATAPVTIVEFSDFHCPFCKRVQPALTEVLERYGDRIRLVYRDFPLDRLHPAARRAAEAARCAAEQEKFWPYHDVLYSRAPRGSDEDLKGYAREVGLDPDAFEGCLSSGKYRNAVRRDVEEGGRLGVGGTPTFFINGRLLSGAQSVEAFVSIIEDELSRRR